MTPHEKQFERRRAVWIALSELYLDTDLKTADHNRISDVIVKAGYTIEEVEYVLRRELGPILGVNTLSPTGEWAGFDPDWLVDAVLRRHQSWRRYLPSFNAFRLIRNQWQPIRRLVEAQQAENLSL